MRCAPPCLPTVPRPPASPAPAQPRAAWRTWAAALALGALLAGAGPRPLRAQTPPPAQAMEATPLRLALVPDEAPGELSRRGQALARLLGERLGRPVQFQPVADRAGLLQALLEQRIDLAWLDGSLIAQGQSQSEGQLLPLAQRPADQHLRLVFVTADPAVHRLGDLRGRSLAFGLPGQALTHLLPRAALVQAGLVPERDLARMAFAGTPEATLQWVGGGKTSAGVLPAAAWEQLLASGRADPARVRVVHIAEGCCGHAWTVNASLEPATREALRALMTGLQPGEAADGPLLAALRSEGPLVAARPQAWLPLEAAGRAARAW